MKEQISSRLIMIQKADKTQNMKLKLILYF